MANVVRRLSGSSEAGRRDHGVLQAVLLPDLGFHAQQVHEGVLQGELDDLQVPRLLQQPLDFLAGQGDALGDLLLGQLLLVVQPGDPGDEVLFGLRRQRSRPARRVFISAPAGIGCHDPLLQYDVGVHRRLARGQHRVRGSGPSRRRRTAPPSRNRGTRHRDARMIRAVLVPDLGLRRVARAPRP